MHDPEKKVSDGKELQTFRIKIMRQNKESERDE